MLYFEKKMVFNVEDKNLQDFINACNENFPCYTSKALIREVFKNQDKWQIWVSLYKQDALNIRNHEDFKFFLEVMAKRGKQKNNRF